MSIADFSEIAGNRSLSASWEAQDTIFFTPDVTKGIWRVSSAGGTPTAVTTPIAGESFHIWPQLLPGGKAVLFSAIADGPDPYAYVQVLDTGERKTLVRVSGLGMSPLDILSSRKLVRSWPCHSISHGSKSQDPRSVSFPG